MRRAALAACLLAAALAPLPAAAAEDTWDADVEAAERYRAEERERAERYRARVEAKAESAPERAEAESAPREGAPERFAARLQAWLADLVADLLNAITDALRRAVAEWFGVETPEAERRGDGLPSGDGLAPGASDDLDGWLRREQERAREWLAGEGAEPGAAPPAAEREADEAR